MSANTTVDFKCVITDATFRVCTKRVSPGIILGHAEALKKTPAIYPFMRSVLKTHNIAQGQQSVSIDHLFNGDVPEEVIVGIVGSEAYTGNIQKNGFYFHNFGLNFLSFYIDAKQCK